MSRNTTLILTNYFIGVIIRLWLFLIDYNTVFMDRVEISTPLNSWRRVIEADYISKVSNSPNPYESVMYETPLHHKFYIALSDLFRDKIYLVFIIADILTAYCLCIAGKKYLETLFKKEISNIDNYLPDAVNFIIKEQEVESVDVYIIAAYMLNPYIIFNCVGKTTTVFQNLYLSLFFVGIVKRNVFLATVPLAAAITQSFYPILLLAPLFVTFNDKRFNAALVTTLTLITSGLILIISSYLVPTWSYLNHSLKFILSAPEFTPNIGLFWYFFIEMFEHFRTLFMYSFQLNVIALYVIPLTLRFRQDPVLLTTSLLGIITIFKSYPSIGDVGFVFAVLPFWKHLQFYMQQGLLTSVSFFMVTLLAPTVWHLWLYSGSANANFYFGATLVFATAQIFMLTDLLFAYIKREYIIKYGCVKECDGQEAVLLLE